MIFSDTLDSWDEEPNVFDLPVSGDSSSCEEREIDRVLQSQSAAFRTMALQDHPESSFLRMKIRGDQDETRWLNVTPEQVRQIKEVLK